MVRKKKHSEENDEIELNDEKTSEECDYGLDDEIVPKWYEHFKDEPIQDEVPSEEELTSLRIEAQQVLENETKFYFSKLTKGKKSADAAWIKTVLSKGTSKDKIAANIITIQNAPVYNSSALSSLIGMVKASKKHECTLVMDSLVDLFLEDLLKPDVKLKTFNQQPLGKLYEITSGCARARKARMAAWFFEEKLKENYLKFIQALDVVAKDTVENMRIRAVSALSKLLAGHPEQEQRLLKIIVNKLGDTSARVVSKVIYSVTQLLRVHPAMKQVVMNEVEKLLFRPNINTRTQYYTICLLTQYIFRDKDREIARNIINIYFSFFKAAVKKGEVDSRLMGALLMGVKRAIPFAKLTPDAMKNSIDTLYKLVHLTSFNISLHALALLQEVATESDDRFYSAFYKKLLDRDLSKTCHHAMLINLLFKAITKDSNIPRVKAMIKRLLQICLYLPVPLTCGFLYLISELFSQRRTLLALQTEPIPDVMDVTKVEDFSDDDGEEKYADVEKIESKVEEEMTRSEDDKSLLYTEKELEGDESVVIKEEDEPNGSKPTSGWVFRNFGKTTTPRRFEHVYDAFARNPIYANAVKTAYFELLDLTAHFHPTVSLFAHKLLTCEKIIYSGDPLVDFTLVRFLDRFCFKNPKSSSGESKGPDPTLARRRYYLPAGVKSVPVMSSHYLGQQLTQIPVDELFLYKYLKERHGDGSHLNRTEDDDNASVASEEFEEMLDNMMGGKRAKGLDFMEDIGDKLKNNKSIGDDDFDTEDEDEEPEENQIEELNIVNNGADGDEDDFSELELDEDDDDAEAIDFDDDGSPDEDIDFDEIDDLDTSTSRKGNLMKKKKKAMKNFKTRGGLEGLFAPAEEFAEILEEAGSSKEKQGMIGALSNTDNSAPKQIAWESKRDRWVRGMGNRKRKFHNKNRTRPQNKRRKNN